MEEANFLTKFASEVMIVNRRVELRASKIMQDRARNNPKISWTLNVTPTEVVDNGSKVVGLKVKDNQTGEEKTIETDVLGYIIVQPGTTYTNAEAVFACGDVQDQKYRQAITAAGSGCMAALDCERYLEGSAVHDWSKSL